MSVDKNNLFQQSLHDTVSYESQKCHFWMGWSVFSQALKLHEVSTGLQDLYKCQTGNFNVWL